MPSSASDSAADGLPSVVDSATNGWIPPPVALADADEDVFVSPSDPAPAPELPDVVVTDSIPPDQVVQPSAPPQSDAPIPLPPPVLEAAPAGTDLTTPPAAAAAAVEVEPAPEVQEVDVQQSEAVQIEEAAQEPPRPPPAQAVPSLPAALPVRGGSKVEDDDLRKLLKMPDYLADAVLAAVESGVSPDQGEFPASAQVELPNCPLFVFVNSKSGGRLGPALQSLLIDYLGIPQVFDLSKHSPSNVLSRGLACIDKLAAGGDECAKHVRRNLRLMVAGGDGTVGWVLASVADLHLGDPATTPPVAIIPLGTGNDLSRSFGWGGGFGAARRSAVKRWLFKATTATIAFLDCWQVEVHSAHGKEKSKLKLPHALHPQHHVPLPVQGHHSTFAPVDDTTTYEGYFWNYFSIGMDAQVTYGFHQLRDEKPWLAKGRLTNQLIYSGYGCGQGWFCTPCSSHPRARGVNNTVRLQIKRTVDGEWNDVAIPPSVRAVVVLNLQSYAGGRHPWGSPTNGTLQKKGFVEASVEDGVLEVVGLRDGWHTALIMVNMLTAIRLTQARALRLELKGVNRQRAYMQIDGEPWQQPLSADELTVVEIGLVPQRAMLLR